MNQATTKRKFLSPLPNISSPKNQKRTSSFRHCLFKLCSASSLLALRVQHNNNFLTSSVSNPLIISTPLSLISFLSSSKTLLLPVVLTSLSSTVFGWKKPFLFNLPSNKSCLKIIRPLCLLLISRTWYAIDLVCICISYYTTHNSSVVEKHERMLMLIHA